MFTKRTGLLLSILTSTLLLAAIYKNAFFHPNNYLFCAGGDGIKNYFNYAGHIKNDPGYSQLSMISYPHGESLLMEDSLPLLSSAMKIIATFFPAVNNYSIGILNFLMLFSFIVAVCFVYLIFKHFKLPTVLSVISANAVCLLASNFLLINNAGHWGLSFVCFFPMGWFLILKYYSSKSKLLSALVIVNILLWGYFHIYLGLILASFTLLVHIIKLSTRRPSSQEIILALSQVVLPILIFAGLIKINDIHPNRIDMPFMPEYRTSFYSTFIPATSPLKPLYSYVFDLKPQESLSWCNIGNYIGLTSNIAILLLFCIMLYYVSRKQLNKAKHIFSDDLHIYLASSLILLLYAMAIPLKYFSMEFQNSIPLLKQFAALGRFGWPFYFVIAVFSILFLYRILHNKLSSKIVYFVLVSVYFIESSFHFQIASDIVKSNNEFTSSLLSNKNRRLFNIKKEDYQAILTLPMYFKFGVPFSKKNSDSLIYTSMLMSYHTGLPILSTYLSRPSVSESLEIFTLTQEHPYRYIANQIRSSKKDIAVLYYMPDSANLNNSEKNIIRESTLLLKSGNYALLKLSIHNLAINDNRTNRNDFAKIASELHSKNGLWVEDTTEFIFYNSYNSSTNQPVYRGKGSYHGKKTDYNYILETSTTKMDTASEYLLSFWYYNYVWDQSFNTVVIQEIDSLGKDLQYEYYSPLSTNIIDKWWYLSEKRFKIKSNKSHLKIFMNGQNYFRNWIAIDEVIIRPVSLDVFKLDNTKEEGNIYKNNTLFCK